MSIPRKDRALRCRRPARPPKRKRKSCSGRFLWLVVIAAVAVGGWWFLQSGR